MEHQSKICKGCLPSCYDNNPLSRTTRYGMQARARPGCFRPSPVVPPSRPALGASCARTDRGPGPDCSLQCHCRFFVRSLPIPMQFGRKDAAAAVRRWKRERERERERDMPIAVAVVVTGMAWHGMDGSQTSTSLSTTMAMFPFYPFFLPLSLPPFILISAPSEPRSVVKGTHGETAPSEVARESATYESWESGAASEYSW